MQKKTEKKEKERERKRNKEKEKKEGREKMINSKSSLAVQLSKLKVFARPSVKLEQYPTDPEVAADVLWNAHLSGDIEDKVVADLGCGTGILGIGALLLGAKKVFFIDKDGEALQLLEKNIESVKEEIEGKHEIKKEEVEDTELDKVDVVIQNPPFGTRKEHADKAFLEKAFKISDVVYSFHKTSTKRFLEAITEDNGFKITHRWEYQFMLKKTQEHHTKRIKRIEVSCFRIEKG